MSGTTQTLVGRVLEADFGREDSMDLLCRMENGVLVTLENIPDTRVGSATVVTITYTLETPEAS